MPRWPGFDSLGQMGSDYFNEVANHDQALRLFFEGKGLKGNALEYALRQAQSIEANYAKTSFDAVQAGGKAPIFTEWLQQGGSDQAIQGYNQLSARNRGANPGRFQTGRMMF